MWSAARSAKISMILCMPERVSGGDAKFQGFCDRWNKWEGHQKTFRRLKAYRQLPILRNALQEHLRKAQADSAIETIMKAA